MRWSGQSSIRAKGERGVQLSLNRGLGGGKIRNWVRHERSGSAVGFENFIHRKRDKQRKKKTNGTALFEYDLRTLWKAVVELNTVPNEGSEKIDSTKREVRSKKIS